MPPHADTGSEVGSVADTGGDGEHMLGHRPVTVQQELMFTTQPPAAPAPHVVASHIAGSAAGRGPAAPPVHTTRSVVRTLHGLYRLHVIFTRVSF